MWKIPPGKYGKQDRTASLDDEEISPVLECTRMDVKDTVGKETTKCRGDTLSSVEDSKTSSELSSAIEGRLIVDDQWKECRFTHAKEPTKGEESTEVFHCSNEKSEASEAEHHARQNLG